MEVGVVRRVGDVEVDVDEDERVEVVDVEERFEVVEVVRVGVADILEVLAMRCLVDS